MRTTVDKFGRVLIPKRLRDQLGLKAGSVLSVEEQEEQVVLKPVGQPPAVKVKEGVLVYGGEAAGEIALAVASSRVERLRRLGGTGAR